MANMWPRSLPQEVAGDPLRRAECEVYERLKQILDGSFHVFYACPWLGVGPDGGEVDGECDFVVAHPRRGILVLEVKGGAVAFDPESDQWTSRDRAGVEHRIKDPVSQARSSKYQLLEKLKDTPGWHERYIRMRHGVVLPDASLPEGVLGADRPREIFWSCEDFRRDGSGEWIGSRMGVAPKAEDWEKPLGNDGIRALEKILANPVHFRMPLQNLLSADDRRLEVLTRNQFWVLESIREQSRVAISGAAGTGKTMLALEEAARQAEGGRRVLFVCFNRALSAWARRGLGEDAAFEVRTFHSLCGHMKKRAGLDPPSDATSRTPPDDPAQVSREWYDQAPDVLMTAFERLPDVRYDAIIVDEGQDFRKHWWIALDTGLKSGGVLRVFYDSNQRVHQEAGELPKDVEASRFRLVKNLRNTLQIHAAVHRFYVGSEIEASGTEGTEVEWLPVPAEGLAATGRVLSEYAGRLIADQGVPPGDIAVLVPSEKGIGAITSDGRFGGCETTRCEKPCDGAIVVDSIRRFKGLERPVVLLAADQSLVDKRELPYVAMSRARVHLAIAGEDRILDWLRKPILDTMDAEDPSEVRK